MVIPAVNVVCIFRDCTHYNFIALPITPDAPLPQSILYILVNFS